MALFRFTVVIIVLSFLNCAAPMKQFYPGTFFQEDRTYQNKSLGFSLCYRGNWQITTDPNDMKEHKEYAKSLQESGVELLFIGFTVEKTQGTRCIVTNLNTSNREYAEQILRINKDATNTQNVLTDVVINGVPMVQWEYDWMLDKEKVKFVEYFFNLDTYNLRIAFWTKPGLFNNFLPVYDDIMATLNIYDR
jgi:hypothetical protein